MPMNATDYKAGTKYLLKMWWLFQIQKVKYLFSSRSPVANDIEFLNLSWLSLIPKDMSKVA